MSTTMLLAIAVGVFIMLVLGIALTIYEFHKAGSEPVKGSNPVRNKSRR